MKKNIFLPCLTILCLFSACAQKDTNNDQTSIHARADSAVGSRMEEINQEAMESLEQRIAVEVKAKADSIVAARTSGPEKIAPVPADALSSRKNMPVNPLSKMRGNDSTKR